MGKTSSPVDMQFYGLEWIGIWANQKMSIYRLYNKMWYRPDNINIDRGGAGASVNIGIIWSISHHIQCLISQ